MKILITLILSLLLFVLYVRYLEETSIFFPEKDILRNPKQIGLEYDDIYFKARDGVKLHGWFVKKPGAKSTVIFFHGNAGNISDRLEKIALLSKLGLNVFIIDYRGFGKSEGKPSESGIYLDAKAAFDHVAGRDDVSKEKIVIYGVSLGGAVAVDLAVRLDAGYLLVDSSFSSARDVAKRMYPFVPGFLLRTKMDSANKVKNISIPKLFIHSRDDTTIPFYLGKRLYDAAKKPKEFLEIRGGHNDGHVLAGDEYWNGIEAFLRKYNLL